LLLIHTDTTTTYYIYSGDQVIAEYDVAHGLTDKYVYAGDRLMAKFINTTKEFYISDIRGSVAAVLSYDGSTINSSYEYYPFGQILTATGEDRYKFIAKELDEGYNVDLYYFGARYCIE
jgi:hypothetical protein